MITWDMDSSFGNDPDGTYHESYETSDDRGILSKHVLFLRLMEIPEYQQLFWQKIADIRDQGFPYLLEVVKKTYDTIKNDVYQDPQKICTNLDFDQAFNQLQSYLTNRKQFLYSDLSFKSLSLYEPFCSYPDTVNPAEINFRIKSTKKQIITLYLAKNVAFGEWNINFDTENFDLFDDGLHNDHEAGDLIYGNTLKLNEAHQGVMPYAFYTTYESSPLHGFFYLKYHSHIGPAININTQAAYKQFNLQFGNIIKLATDYLVPLINLSEEAVDLSHFHFQAGAYYQRIVFPVTTSIGAKDTLFLTSNLEMMQELYPAKNFIEQIYFDINPDDTLKILAPTYSEVVTEICREIMPLTGVIKDIVITEINYNSDINFDTKDWVEFYNPNRISIDISNWYFQDSKKDNIFIFPNESKISPHGTVILCRDRDAFIKYQTGSVALTGDFDFNLKGKGEFICLRNESGEVIDSLTYQSVKPWPENTNGTGYTLVLDNPHSDNSDAKNWRASYQVGGTPGSVVDLTTSNQEIPEAPTCFVLDQNYPNPFNETASIRYFLLKPVHVELKLFTITGQYITSLENKYQHDGCYQCTLTAENLSSGIYIYSLYLNHRPVSSRKALLVK
jgi:hypothetical protein